MSKNLVDMFTTNEYKLLRFLSGLQSTTAEGKIILNSQEDIAKQFNQSIATINKLMQNLCSVGCVEKRGQRKGYLITEQGKHVLKQIESINLQFINKRKWVEK